MTKEIGGYIEFEYFHKKMLHEIAIKLNSGRSCLEYLIKAKNIKEIYLPYFNCEVIAQTCEKCNVKINYYNIDKKLRPILNNVHDKWVYLINFYGQISNKEIKSFAKCNKILVDNTHAYFQKPIKNLDTMYSCRKFFGVADGGILYTDAILKEKLKEGFAYDKMQFLMGRLEKSASEFYKDNIQNNNRFATEEMSLMPKMTENILKALDYKRIKNIRTKNFKCLNKQLKTINQLEIKNVSGAYAYPLLVENGADIRKKLAQKKIYIPCLWPNVLEETNKDSLEYNFANNILPIPCDQRYSYNEMLIICKEIKKCIS